MASIAGAVGAVASVAGTAMSMSSSGSASGAQASGYDQAAALQYAAAQQSLELQKEMWRTGRDDTAPWRVTGGNALRELSELYGIRPWDAPVAADATPGHWDETVTTTRGAPTTEPDPVKGRGGSSRLNDILLGRGIDPAAFPVAPGPGDATTTSRTWVPPTDAVAAWDRDAAQQTAMSHFFTTPQYTWNLKMGLDAVERGAAARGLLNSGAEQKALQRFGAGLASGEFGGYTGMLSQLAGYGNTSAANAASTAAMTGANMGNTITQGALAQGGYLGAAGTARASGYINQSNAFNNGLQNLYGSSRGGGWGGSSGFGGLSNLWGGGGGGSSGNWGMSNPIFNGGGNSGWVDSGWSGGFDFGGSFA